jgi:hypothetical protein
MRLTQAQINAAYGKTFEVFGVLNGCGKVRFLGIAPSGNVMVKRATDPELFGVLTISPGAAQRLFQAIEVKYDKAGKMIFPQ